MPRGGVGGPEPPWVPLLGLWGRRQRGLRAPRRVHLAGSSCLAPVQGLERKREAAAGGEISSAASDVSQPHGWGGRGARAAPVHQSIRCPKCHRAREGVTLSPGSYALQVTSPELAGGSRPHHPCWEQWGPPSRLSRVPPAAGLRERCLQPPVLLLTLPAPLPCPETPPGLLGPTLPAHPWGNRPEPPTLCCSCVQGRREGWRNGEM